MTTFFSRTRTTIVAMGGAVMLLLAGLAPASAHVEMTADSTAAGSTTLVRVSFSHGCDGSATTEIAIQIPEQITTVRPGMNYGWTVEKVTEDAGTPATPAADGHGDATSRVSEVVYTAKEPVPDGFYDELVLQVALPDEAEGDMLYFPVIQTCEEGETAWVQIPDAGQDSEEMESPAPSITITAPEPDGHE